MRGGWPLGSPVSEGLKEVRDLKDGSRKAEVGEERRIK